MTYAIRAYYRPIFKSLAGSRSLNVQELPIFIRQAIAARTKNFQVKSMGLTASKITSAVLRALKHSNRCRPTIMNEYTSRVKTLYAVYGIDDLHEGLLEY